jgi:hypothetical protein
LSACAPSPQWSKRSSIPTSACTTRERYICGAALVCLRACTAGRRRGQNAVRDAPAGTCRDSFGTVLVGRVTTCLALTCLLSGRSSLLHR